MSLYEEFSQKAANQGHDMVEEDPSVWICSKCGFTIKYDTGWISGWIYKDLNYTCKEFLIKNIIQ